MATLEINIGDEKQSYQYPKSWDELTPRQFRKTCNIIASNNDLGVVRVKLLMHLLKLKIGWRKPKPETSHIFNLPTAELHTLLHNKDILGWLYSGNGPSKMLIKKFRHNGRVYYAPPSRLTNVCTVELIGAFQCFKEFSRTKDQQYLDKLISLLYRPKEKWRLFASFSKRFNKDKREPLNQVLWEEREKTFKNLNHGIRIAVLNQFNGHWKIFESKYKYIFVKSKKTDEGTGGLMNLLFDVSGKIFGNMEQTKMAPADEVFKYVDMQIKVNKDLEKRLKRPNRQ